LARLGEAGRGTATKAATDSVGSTPTAAPVGKRRERKRVTHLALDGKERALCGRLHCDVFFDETKVTCPDCLDRMQRRKEAHEAL
jgi:hypothetical protein